MVLMVRHVVAFRLKARDAAERAADAVRIQDALQSLRGRIDEILDLHVGIDLGLVDGHWEVVLVSDFIDNAALERYQAHPEHVRVAQGISGLVSDRAVVDYELAA
jgi:hypothetical protein